MRNTLVFIGIVLSWVGIALTCPFFDSSDTQIDVGITSVLLGSVVTLVAGGLRYLIGTLLMWAGMALYALGYYS